MARPKLNLKTIHEDESVIFLVFRYKRLNKTVRLKYSTRVIVPVKLWDNDKQQVKRVAGYPQATDINRVLANYVNQAEQIYYRYQANDKIKELTKDRFKEELDIAFKRHSKRSIDLIGYFEQYVSKLKKECLKTSSPTWKYYNTDLGRVKKYYKIKSFDFDDINLEWLEQYKDFLYSTGISSITVNKACSRLKTVLKRALAEKVHNNTDFQTDLFRVQVIHKGHTYLTQQEIAKLYHLSIDKAGHEQIRDIFVLACFTGLRASDWGKITINNFSVVDGVQMFTLRTKKKDRNISIPAHPAVLAILKKYNWDLPTFAEPYINRVIKKICEKAKINTLVTLKESAGGKVKSVQQPKHELITMHTARRSFATNAFLSGVEMEVIKDLLGHSKLSTTEKYIKASGVEKAKKAAQNKFFTGEGFLKAV